MLELLPPLDYGHEDGRFSSYSNFDDGNERESCSHTASVFLFHINCTTFQ